mmetsp:Transcript_14359/g.36683  ORF Transcript_14359/g.36683 Transcript_14359/m.36683 type:complete len:229 (-) Transcript_14359:474-1160(-)
MLWQSSDGSMRGVGGTREGARRRASQRAARATGCVSEQSRHATRARKPRPPPLVVARANVLIVPPCPLRLEVRPVGLDLGIGDGNLLAFDGDPLRLVRLVEPEVLGLAHPDVWDARLVPRDHEVIVEVGDKERALVPERPRKLHRLAKALRLAVGLREANAALRGEVALEADLLLIARDAEVCRGLDSGAAALDGEREVVELEEGREGGREPREEVGYETGLVSPGVE